SETPTLCRLCEEEDETPIYLIYDCLRTGMDELALETRETLKKTLLEEFLLNTNNYLFKFNLFKNLISSASTVHDRLIPH
ncbi:Hypothetical protein FKW44_024006, partial [Caligus rogercresseyi]